MKYLFTIMCLVLSIMAINAQDKLLSAEELKKEPWFYAIEDAMENPKAVYKLSVTWEKLKEFPKEVFNFTNLQLLDLMDNEIRTIPADIAKLKHLQSLLLSNNKIAALPEELKQLEHLEDLGLERNKMTGLPDWIVEIKKLKKIVLRDNLVSEADLDALDKKFENIKVTR